MDPDAVTVSLQGLTRAATFVYPTRRINAALDEDDDRFLAYCPIRSVCASMP